MLIRYVRCGAFVFREIHLIVCPASNLLILTTPATTAPASSDPRKSDASCSTEVRIVECNESAETADGSALWHTLESIQQRGVWIVEDDLTSRGGFEDSVAPIACVFGVRVHPSVRAELSRLRAVLGALDRAHSVTCEPLSLYHGTHTAAAQGLLRTRAPHESEGLLGLGFYVASFFKACRFASRGQAPFAPDHAVAGHAPPRTRSASTETRTAAGSSEDSTGAPRTQTQEAPYALRAQGDAAVVRVRVLVKPTEIVESEKKRRECTCAACQESLRAHPHSAARLRMAQLSDHVSAWRHVRVKREIGTPPQLAQGVHLGVSAATALSSHRGRWGGHYMSRHDEWCFRAERVLPCDAALLDTATVRADVYDPLQRSQAIVARAAAPEADSGSAHRVCT